MIVAAVRQSTLRVYLLSQGLLIAAAIALATLTYRGVDWHPILLFVLLGLLSAYGERLTITFGSQNVSASFISLVLAMTLLGPAPALAIGVLARAVDTLIRRPPVVGALTNLATYAAYLVAGALLARLLVGDVHAHDFSQTVDSTTFAFSVFAVFIVTNLANFVLIALHHRVILGKTFRMQVQSVLIPVLPGQLVTGGFAAILAVVYLKLGYSVLVGLVLVLLIFQYLAVALARSEDRAEQLRARSLNLASLQLGVLATLVETLALRDRAAASHAASVARYSRALAKEIGCSEEDQDVVHTAALLHDVGKFALPDRILHADVLSGDDWIAIRRHPQDGATLVGRLDGYGPVADIILYHHEHVDGTGYPAGLIGNEIPLMARVLAVGNVYDTLTARDSYRPRMTPQDAITELRRVAGASLDEELVRSFVELLEREGAVPFTQAGADFETELAFERRARALAAPVR